MGNPVGPSDPRGNMMKRKETEKVPVEETPDPSLSEKNGDDSSENANTATAGGSESD